MNDEPLNKLFKAGRVAKPDTSPAEFGFEARLMGQIRSEAQRQTPWFAFTWRLAPVFAAIVLALGVWNLTEEGLGPADLHAAMAGETQDSLVAGYLAGD